MDTPPQNGNPISSETPPEIHRLALLWRFLRYLKPYRSYQSGVFALLVLSTVTSLAPPYLMKVIIDEVFPYKDLELLFLVLASLLGLALLGAGFFFAGNYLYHWVGFQVMVDIQDAFFAHLLQLPQGFHQQHPSGDLIFRVRDDLKKIREFITIDLLFVVNHLLTLAGLAAILCWLNYQLFLLSLPVVPLLLLALRWFQPRLHRITTRSQQQSADILSAYKESFDQVNIIQAYEGYEYERTCLRTRFRSLVDTMLQSVVCSSGLSALSATLLSLGPLVVFGWGGYQVILGSMSVGAVVAFLQYLMRLFTPVQELNNLYVAFVQTSVSMQRVVALLDLPTEQPQGSRRLAEFSFAQGIAFEKVHFGFDGQPVIRGLDLTLKRGGKYALVGASGCGKSTLLDLLCGFCIPTQGFIAIDGIDVRALDLRALRRRIGLVPQRSRLFPGTARENIRYGNWEKGDEALDRAARAAGLDGLETVVGEGGGQLSGGQQQRIALARALLKDAEILILDEATSALDSEGERTLFAQIRRLYGDRTVLLVSHRLSTVKDADQIICMADGIVAEQGTHAELLARRGVYWRLFCDQLNDLPVDKF
jgi:ABC-type multidrug transport system fused ATPase/permease subunit